MRFLTTRLRALRASLRVLAGTHKLARFRPRVPKTGRRRVVFGVVVIATMTSFVAVALGVGSGVLTGPPASPSSFESGDGNMTVETSGDADWNSVAAAGNCLANTANFGSCTNGAYVHVVDPQAGTSTDEAWKSGQKQDTTVCPTIQASNVPGKDDLTDVASYNETAIVNNALTDTFLYGATIRTTANGNASENVELQRKVGTDGTTAGTCTTVNGQTLYNRVAGDYLIGIDYLNGGTNVQFDISHWIITGGKGSCAVANDVAPCWSTTTTIDSASTYANGQANASAISSGDNGINGNDLVAQQFAEFGINLSHYGIVPSGACAPFANVVWESRTSGSSFTSNPEDEEIEGHSLSNCGEIKVIKATSPAGANKTFDFTSGQTTSTSGLNQNGSAGGVNCPTTAGVQLGGSFCLNADTTDNGTHANAVDENGLAPGSYSFNEPSADLPSGWGLHDVACTSANGTTEPSSTTSGDITVSLGAGDVVTCTYTNSQLLGAIQVTKTDDKGNNLQGAQFTYKGTDGMTHNFPSTTNSSGIACVAGLPFDTYAVAESSAPPGYTKADSQDVTISSAGTCSSGYTTPTNSYVDVPMTKLDVKATWDGTGLTPTNPGTKSNISCTGTATDTSNTVSFGTDSPAPANNQTTGATQYANPDELTHDGLPPGTYTCTVVIDP